MGFAPHLPPAPCSGAASIPMLLRRGGSQRSEQTQCAIVFNTESGIKYLELYQSRWAENNFCYR